MPRVALFALLLCCAVVGSATANVYYGVTFGLGFSSLETEVLPADESRTGILAGLFAGTHLDDRLSAELGLQYSQRGGNGTVTDTLTLGPTFLDEGAIRYEFEYIVLPVTLRYQFGPTAIGAPFARLGGEAGFLVDAKMVTSKSTQSMKDVLKSYDILFAIGGGLQIPVGSREGLLEIGYRQGLEYVQDYRVRTEVEAGVRIKNRSFYLSGGIVF